MGAVTTRSYSNLRDGACFDENKLTSINVQKNGIRVLGQIQLDDPRGTEGQVLYVPNLQMRDRQYHNVAFVGDMSNNVSAFDVDTCRILWKQCLGRPVAVTKKLDMWGINPSWGILGTGVIDLSTQRIYHAVLNSRDGTIDNSVYELHGLSLVDGTPIFEPLVLNGATYQNFKLGQVARKQRPGLLLDKRNGKTTIFIAFGSFAESAATNQGWVLAIDVTVDPEIAATWVTGTKHSPASGIWMGGQGLAMDNDGFIYGMTGNGSFAPPTDFGECFFKLKYTPATSAAAAKLECVDWWSPYSDAGRDGLDPTLPVDAAGAGDDMMMSDPVPTNADRIADEDLGSGGALLIPSSLTGFKWNGVFGAGKDGVGYMVNADDMGKTTNADFAPGKTDANFDKLIFSQPYNWTDYMGGFDARKNPMTIPGGYQGYTKHQHSTPVIWKSPDHGWLMYTQGENSPVRVYQLTSTGLQYLACGQEIASAGMPPPGGMPGGMMVLSSAGQGTNTGVLWVTMPLNGDANKHVSQGRLVAYGANWIANGTTLIKLWDSADWNVVYMHPKFNLPTVADGKVLLPSYDGRVLVLG